MFLPITPCAFHCNPIFSFASKNITPRPCITRAALLSSRNNVFVFKTRVSESNFPKKIPSGLQKTEVVEGRRGSPCFCAPVRGVDTLTNELSVSKLSVSSFDCQRARPKVGQAFFNKNFCTPVQNVQEVAKVCSSSFPCQLRVPHRTTDLARGLACSWTIFCFVCLAFDTFSQRLWSWKGETYSKKKRFGCQRVEFS